MDSRALQVLRCRKRALTEAGWQPERATAAAYRGLDPAALAVHVVPRDQE